MSILQEVAEEHNNGWILCSEQMPEEHDSIFARYKGTDNWHESMSVKSLSLNVICIIIIFSP